MSEVRLNIIDAREAIHGTIHGSVGDSVIASLSAEPETIAELEAALDRFNKRVGDQTHFVGFVSGEDTRHWDAGVVIVDLAARIVAIDSSYSAPQSQDQVNYHDGNSATDVWLPYRIPDDWLLLSSVIEYQSMRARRRALRTAEPCLEVRPVLYGRPLIDFIVSECLDESERLAGCTRVQADPEPHVDSALDCAEDLDGDEQIEALVRPMHARWLMTSRTDLGDRTPRDVIMEKMDFLEFDLHSREMQWSLLNEAPPPLSRDSRAYRLAGFGFHEYVIYYYLVRHLLVECWKRINDRTCVESNEVTGQAEDSPPRVARREVLLEWLEQIREAWLNNPSEEFDGRIPAAIIESERRRIPLAMSAKQMMVDENCELCRMLADETNDFGPGFWHLDGCNMAGAFEFSSYKTRDEWEAEQRQWQEFSEEFERKWAAEHPTPEKQDSFLDHIDD